MAYNFQMPGGALDPQYDPNMQNLMYMLQGSGQPTAPTMGPDTQAVPSVPDFKSLVMGQMGGQPQNQPANAGVPPPPPPQPPAAQPAQSPVATAQAQAQPPTPDQGGPAAPGVTGLPQDVTAQAPQAMTPNVADMQQQSRAGAAAGTGNPMMQMLHDPGAMLAIAAVLGQAPNQGESGIGQLARAMTIGNAYVNAKNYNAQEQARQAGLDAQSAATAQSDINYKSALTGASIQKTQEDQANQDLTRRTIQTKLDAAQQDILNAKSNAERTAAETAHQKLENDLRSKYGDQQVQAALDQSAASTSASNASAAASTQSVEASKVATTAAQAKIDAIKALPPEQQARAWIGGTPPKDWDDRYLDYVTKNAKQYTTLDPVSGAQNFNADAAYNDFTKVYGKNPAPGAPDPSAQKQSSIDPKDVRAAAMDAVKRGASKSAVNQRLKEKGYAPLD